MADNNFKGTVDALFQGIDGVVSSKTVVGDAIHIGETIILPLVDVSFAVGAGAFNAEKKERGAGGIGGKMTPCAVLVTYNRKKDGGMNLKRVVGFALFWVAVGIILALFLPNTFVEVLCVLLCVLAGYNLFFC